MRNFCMRLDDAPAAIDRIQAVPHVAQGHFGDAGSHDREDPPRPAPVRRTRRKTLAQARGRTTPDVVCARSFGMCTALAMNCAPAPPEITLVRSRRPLVSEPS